MRFTSPRKALPKALAAALVAILALACAAPAQSPAAAQSPLAAGLLERLQSGGYVIVMRHASSPMTLPTADIADTDNTALERQLDQQGRDDATKFGDDLRARNIPIGTILSSPTYRALETIKLAKLGEPRIQAELGENGKSMLATAATQADWLHLHIKDFPTGTNTLMVTHYPNLTAAFPLEAKGITDGEALIFGPGDKGGATLVARMKLGDWANLRP